MGHVLCIYGSCFVYYCSSYLPHMNYFTFIYNLRWMKVDGTYLFHLKNHIQHSENGTSMQSIISVYLSAKVVIGRTCFSLCCTCLHRCSGTLYQRPVLPAEYRMLLIWRSKTLLKTTPADIRRGYSHRILSARRW